MPRPGRGGMTVEKSKDFKGSILRLLKNLSPWKVIMIFALLLAMTGAIVSLIAPNKLSEFADLISVALKGKDIHIFVITNKNPMTLKEASEYVKMFGVDKAMAFDGGSSTSMNYLDKIDVISTKGDGAGRRLKSFLLVH